MSFDYLQRGLWLLAGPEPAIKAMDAGWSVEEYSRWLVETLTGLLVDPSSVRPEASRRPDPHTR